MRKNVSKKKMLLSKISLVCLSLSAHNQVSLKHTLHTRLCRYSTFFGEGWRGRGIPCVWQTYRFGATRKKITERLPSDCKDPGGWSHENSRGYWKILWGSWVVSTTGTVSLVHTYKHETRTRWRWGCAYAVYYVKTSCSTFGCRYFDSYVDTSFTSILR